MPNGLSNGGARKTRAFHVPFEERALDREVADLRAVRAARARRRGGRLGGVLGRRAADQAGADRGVDRHPFRQGDDRLADGGRVQAVRAAEALRRRRRGRSRSRSARTARGLATNACAVGCEADVPQPSRRRRFPCVEVGELTPADGPRLLPGGRRDAEDQRVAAVRGQGQVGDAGRSTRFVAAAVRPWEPGSASFRQLPRSKLWAAPQGVPQSVSCRPVMSTCWGMFWPARLSWYSPPSWWISGTKTTGEPNGVKPSSEGAPAAVRG